MPAVPRQPASADAAIEGQERLLRPASLKDRVMSTAEFRTKDIVVGFADRASSGHALEQAIVQTANDENARLVVVHASSSPIAVRNGPSAQIARSMGDPLWATVHSTVLDLGAEPERTLTVIEPGDPAAVIARHCTDASVLYLGPSRRRRFRRRPDLGRRLGAILDCPVVRVAATHDRRPPASRSPKAKRYVAMQPGVTS